MMIGYIFSNVVIKFMKRRSMAERMNFMNIYHPNKAKVYFYVLRIGPRLRIVRVSVAAET